MKMKPFPSCRISYLWLVLLSGLVIPPQAMADEPEMTDSAISDKIDDELLFDLSINSANVDVSTTTGIVTLTGTTDNLLAKERAARIASTVKGVRSVVNRLKVKPYIFKSDDDVKSAVEKALLEDPATESYEVTVEVEDGVVTLDGTVDSYQERELCWTVAKTVAGVKGLTDSISVVYKSDRPAYEIKEEIEARLTWDVLVDNGLVHVNVNKDGHVALSGTVGSAAEKTRANRDAWVAGVKSVDDSKLEVAKWIRDEKLRGKKYVYKDSDELESAIETALAYDPRVSSFNVDADVYSSSVTLRGVVDNLKAKRAAEQDAKNTVGVSHVTNRLKVRPATNVDDKTIQADVESALLSNVFVDRFELTVSVYNGVVHLYGEVDSYFEKSEADNAASKVNGVVDVKNHLTVDYLDPFPYDPYVDDTNIYDYDWYDYQPQFTMKTDDEIRTAIQSELWWSPYVNSDDVTVKVDDGDATLTGTVSSYAAKGAATDNAFDGGATWVDNDLVVLD